MVGVCDYYLISQEAKIEGGGGKVWNSHFRLCLQKLYTLHKLPLPPNSNTVESTWTSWGHLSLFLLLILLLSPPLLLLPPLPPPLLLFYITSFETLSFGLITVLSARRNVLRDPMRDALWYLLRIPSCPKQT